MTSHPPTSRARLEPVALGVPEAAGQRRDVDVVSDAVPATLGDEITRRVLEPVDEDTDGWGA